MLFSLETDRKIQLMQHRIGCGLYALTTYIHEIINSDSVKCLAGDWVFGVDDNTLDMNSNSNCILGQVFTHYTNGIRIMYKRFQKFSESIVQFAIRLGFLPTTYLINPGSDEYIEEMNTLSVQWTKALENERIRLDKSLVVSIRSNQ